MDEQVFVDLVNRARNALSYQGGDETKARTKLEESGVARQDAFLADTMDE